MQLRKSCIPFDKVSELEKSHSQFKWRFRPRRRGDRHLKLPTVSSGASQIVKNLYVKIKSKKSLESWILG